MILVDDYLLLRIHNICAVDMKTDISDLMNNTNLLIVDNKQHLT